MKVPPQLSEAVAVAAQVVPCAASKHAIDSSAAGTVIVGEVLSEMVTFTLQLASYPDKSLTVNLRVTIIGQVPDFVSI